MRDLQIPASFVGGSILHNYLILKRKSDQSLEFKKKNVKVSVSLYFSCNKTETTFYSIQRLNKGIREEKRCVQGNHF